MTSPENLGMGSFNPTENLEVWVFIYPENLEVWFSCIQKIWRFGFSRAKKGQEIISTQSPRSFIVNHSFIHSYSFILRPFFSYHSTA
jgi:hypothetical protein